MSMRSVWHSGTEGAGRVGTSAGVASSVTATGSTVGSAYRRSIVVRGVIASTVSDIDVPLASGSVMVLRP
jgi:hypothetical protein